jgi:PDZ domain
MTSTNAEPTRIVIDDLIELERTIDANIEAATTALSSAKNANAVSFLTVLLATSRQQREDLERQGQQLVAGALSAELPATRSVGRLYAALSKAVFAYAVLHARAHRDFDSQSEGNTADLAESHLRAYGNAIQQLNLLVSDIAVEELGHAGIDCRCQCPACGLGLCLCSPHGSNTVRQVLQEANSEPPERGVRVRRPRAGSEVERAGLEQGDRVVAIDDKEIATDLDAAAVQGAIRAHASGDTLRLRIVQSAGGDVELTVRRP